MIILYKPFFEEQFFSPYHPEWRENQRARPGPMFTIPGPLQVTVQQHRIFRTISPMNGYKSCAPPD